MMNSGVTPPAQRCQPTRAVMDDHILSRPAAQAPSAIASQRPLAPAAEPPAIVVATPIAPSTHAGPAGPLTATAAKET